MYLYPYRYKHTPLCEGDVVIDGNSGWTISGCTPTWRSPTGPVLLGSPGDGEWGWGGRGRGEHCVPLRLNPLSQNQDLNLESLMVTLPRPFTILQQQRSYCRQRTLFFSPSDINCTRDRTEAYVLIFFICTLLNTPRSLQFHLQTKTITKVLEWTVALFPIMRSPSLMS